MSESSPVIVASLDLTLQKGRREWEEIVGAVREEKEVKIKIAHKKRGVTPRSGGKERMSKDDNMIP